jgi:hypothetical protein
VFYTTIPIITVPGQVDYVVTGSGMRFKDTSVNNSTTGSQYPVRDIPYKWIQYQQQLTNTTPAQPAYYAWNGNNGTDSTITVFPTPNGAYTLEVNLCVPQGKLVNDDDQLTLLPDAVILGAYARALVERGEDGGMASSEAAALAKNIVSDQIAIENSRDTSMTEWVAV